MRRPDIPVQPHQHQGDRQGIDDPPFLAGLARQPRPLPGPESDNEADHHGEPQMVQQHEAGDNQWRQDDTGKNALFEHQDSAATCSLVLPKRRCRRAKSASASRMASCLKSGQKRSEK